MDGVAGGAQPSDKTVVDWRGAPSPVDEDDCWRCRHSLLKEKDGERVLSMIGRWKDLVPWRSIIQQARGTLVNAALYYYKRENCVTTAL